MAAFLSAPRRRAREALGLVQQIRELGARPLEARRVDVRDVIRDHFHVRLLGVHARGSDRKCSHDAFLASLIKSTCG
jgi:hypothetical protein